MPVNQATLKATGDIPQVEIVVGFAHFAKYEFFLYDQNGQNPQKFAEGVNSDTILDIFPLPLPVANLHKRTLFWQPAIPSPPGAPNTQFSSLTPIPPNDN